METEKYGERQTRTNYICIKCVSNIKLPRLAHTPLTVHTCVQSADCTKTKMACLASQIPCPPIYVYLARVSRIVVDLVFIHNSKNECILFSIHTYSVICDTILRFT